MYGRGSEVENGKLFCFRFGGVLIFKGNGRLWKKGDE